jgi:eukaryotic-like serine/threonine-protein kinase
MSPRESSDPRNERTRPDMQSISSPGLEDPRVIEALDEYVAALEAGQKPNRRAFLARHADVAEALAECLEGIEALHAASSTGNASSSSSAGTRTTETWQPGTPLGDFRIIREIGRGGMGVVYEAEQLSLGRRIALKILPFALTVDPRQLQRFKNEARAAAQLHHQHIVPIYSVGCERSVHFYAMQYVEGRSLAEVIQELRRLARKGVPPDEVFPAAESTGPYVAHPDADRADTAVQPASALATIYSTDSAGFYRSVAQLAVQAAEALEHAHAYGVVHRDIKPGNLLLDVQSNLWVTDFGLAQFQSEAGLTMTGDLLGTLRYMSPEQALAKRGLIDHRTDLYSLGATLYELLTLRPAYDGRDREELLRQIAFEEPRPLRRINPAVPADLETIVLKAMAKEVDERYASARAMADDLRRYLDHKPILARRPSLRERAAKWSRRHRGVVMTGVLVLLLAAVGLGVSTALIAREKWNTEEALKREQQKADEVERQRAWADKSFRQAKDAVDFLMEVSEEELADRPELGKLRRRLLETALLYYKSFVEERRDDPPSQEEFAKAQTRVNAILGELAAGEGFGRVIYLNFLLEQPSVREELHLSEERSRQLRPGRFWGALPHIRDLRGKSPDTRKQDLETLTRDAETALKGVLTEKQWTRLKQIAWQQGGLDALSDPDVARVVNLSVQQKAQVQSFQKERRKRPHGMFCADGPPGEGHKEPPEDPRKQDQERLLSVLNEEQKVKWKDLMGEPFTGDIPPPFGGPPGGRRDFRHHGSPPG